jgi:pyruvate formate lyase activating enzyme
VAFASTVSGTLYAATFGKIAAEAVDPIEKKPLYHISSRDHSPTRSGRSDATFHCKHCQNWHISQQIAGDCMRSRTSALSRAWNGRLRAGSASIAWTYNEPTIWHEYTLEMGTLARQKGLGTVYVTNGYITEEGTPRNRADAQRVSRRYQVVL